MSIIYHKSPLIADSIYHLQVEPFDVTKTLDNYLTFSIMNFKQAPTPFPAAKKCN